MTAFRTTSGIFFMLFIFVITGCGGKSDTTPPAPSAATPNVDAPKPEGLAINERYKVVHDEVYLMLTISKSKENWAVAGDLYWTKAGANKHEGKEGDRCDGFNATNIRYDAERQELEWDSKLEKNSLGWADPVHSKGTFQEGRKYLNVVSTYSGGQSEARFIKE